MKVWQAGSHLTDQRGARVEDWSWAQTRRRLGVLVRLARPYRARAALAVATLVAFTLVALLPPYLAKLAVDDGIAENDLHTLSVVVVAVLVAMLSMSAGLTRTLGTTGRDDRAIVLRAGSNAELSSFLERGLVTLREDGFDKAKKGLTTVDEILRVTESAM